MSDELPQVDQADDSLTADVPVPPASGRLTGGEQPDPGRQIVRTACWLVLSLGFVAFIALPKVSTHLGVEAEPWDKQGSDYVWRVWWRSRHRIVDLGPAWGSTLVLGALAMVFAMLSIAAVWVALVSHERSAESATFSDIESSASP